MDQVFQIIVLVMSVVIHEVSHGYAARALGDKTAEYAGRLTLNPLKHIDLWGSVLIPLLFILSGSGFIIGWAKPVPFNPYNLKNQKWGEALVAGAGPLSNIILALIFGLLFRLGILPDSSAPIVLTIVAINLVLAIFNLIPVPPLDGSKLLFSVLPARFDYWREQLEKYGLILAIIFAFFLWRFILPVVAWIFVLITGVTA